ncbi:MAG: lamin tail domain-containing protein [Verrucomicrobia bacterium]|nr:lamin tail domain-containing protein [Verrucomicrobiota bacterium]
MRILKVPRLCRAFVFGAFLAVSLLSPHGIQAQLVHGVFREVFSGIGGVNVSDLTGAPAFPNSPSSTNFITDFFEAPTNIDDNYGQRLRALILPPITGSYVFWIATDDGGDLYLSSDEDPAHKVRIAWVVNWTSSREWGKEGNQQSAPISLVAGQRYYIEALQKEGSGGDNLAVRWQLPNSVIEEPIPASRLWVFGGAPTSPPIISQQPASQSVVEGQSAVFAVQASNADPISYQWRRGTVNITGANSATYTLSPVATSDSSATFRCVLTNSLGSVTSQVATLTVTPDVTPPSLIRAINVGTNMIELTFSEAVDTATALATPHYSVNNGVSLSGAAFGSDNRTVRLSTSVITYGVVYVVTVNGVLDRAATPNAIAANSQASFLASPFAPLGIGNPQPAGSCAPVAGGVDITAGGSDVGGASDSMEFCYQVLTGNFDVAVRVASFSLSDPWAKAGLMARETFDPGSRFAAVIATPTLAGTQFSYRDPAAAQAVSSGGFPPNFPNHWLRLKRSGGAFTGYASVDGDAWVQLGSASISLGASLYVGFSVASHNVGLPTQVSMRDFHAVTGGTVGALALPGEVLGPSSRKTGLVVSEIMYKPAARPDARNLEFVEIYNSNPYYEDISGYSVSGDVDFTFPANTILRGGGFLVIAAAPADIQAVYGIGNVVGPYAGSLKRSGTVRLRSDTGAVLLEVSYSNGSPWPLGADGTGHSIVLARPTYGEGYPQAWARSDVIGGSPGAGEAYRPGALRNVVINEFLAHTDANTPLVDALELYNHSNQSVDLSGCVLTDDPSTNRFIVPPGTVLPARGFAAWDETQLGFSLSSSGGLLFLKDPTNSRVLDAVEYAGQAQGVSLGRVPDGAAEWYPLASRSLGSSNGPALVDDIVINEIMHSPISGSSDDCFVELYNRGAQSVNLGGWKFSAGINYTFASNTIINSGGYLVVAQNITNLLARYGNLSSNNTAGNYSGSLGHSGDRLALARPDLVIKTNALGVWSTNHIHVVVDEVAYGSGGRWGRWSGGGGSSLELKDPASNHRMPDNWADSDESAKAPWTTVEATGVLDNGAGAIDFIQVGLLAVGECLIDNVELRPGTAGPNYVSNPGFASGLSGWTPQGDHIRSSLDASAGVGGGACLHIRASDQMWTGANSVVGGITNTTLAAGQTATLRFQARWLAGWPEPLLRVHGNYIEATARLTLPTNLGTPGLPNSRRVANAGPAIAEPTHSPALPAGGQPVLVTARLHDPQGVQSAVVNYRVDPASTVVSAPMRDDGTGGDAIARDGVFTATIPGQAAGARIAFTIVAQDSLGASTVFPVSYADNTPAREALIQFGETDPPGGFGAYHLWMSQVNVARWAGLPDLSNELIDGTFVSGGRVIYNMSGHYAGSPYHQIFDSPVGNPCHYNLSMPDDDRFLGATSFNKIHAPGNGPYDDDTIQREQTAYWVARQLGIPWNYRRYVHLFVNGNRRANGAGVGMMEDTQVPNGDVVAERFPNDSNGDLFKLQPWFEFDVNGGGNNNYSWCTLNEFTTTGGAKKLSRYRWNYQIRKIEDSANRYTNVFNLVDAANLPANSPAMIQNLLAQADIEEWMRSFASVHSVGDWDHFGSQNAQNMYGYKPKSGRWSLLIWDHNIVLGNSGSWGPGANLFSYTGGDVGMDHIYNTPQFTRAMWRAYKEIATGPFDAARVGPVLDAKYAAFLASGVNVASPSAIKSWIESARVSILSQLSSINANAALAVSGASSFSTNTNYITVTGTAPVEAAVLTINGVVAQPAWLNNVAWSVKIALTSGPNALVIGALDLKGRVIPGLASTVTVNYTGPSDPVLGSVLINEIHYNPLVPGSSFVELFNSSPINAFDLSGYRLDGADFSFPGGSIITPGGFLVVANDAVAFAQAYGAAIPIAGLMNGKLDNSGETLRLTRPGVGGAADIVIDEVTYDALPPWPALANGFGSSLQLIDPAQDNRRVMNWTAVSNGPPPTPAPQWRFFSATGTASSSIFYIYLHAAGDVYIDDVTLVAGSVAESGPNLFANGGFESPLSGPWTIGNVGNNSASVISTAAKHSGAASLHLIASAGGSTRDSSIYQTVTPNLAASDYTLSFWYLENPAGGVLTIRASGRWVDSNLDLLPPPPPSAMAAVTPGAANSPLRALPTFPLLWLNEIQPGNVTGIADHLGHHHPWVELFNSGTSAISLAGCYLANNFSNLTQWALPSASIGAGQFQVVYLDGNPGETTAGEWHANLTVPALSGVLALSQVAAGETNVVDYLRYNQVNTDRSYGAFPDGTPTHRIKFFYATPGGSNNNAYPNGPLFINEWMASNTRTLQDPSDLKYDDWFELYNAGGGAVDLAGYTLSNSSNTPAQFVIPAGYVIPAGGYLLVWADKDTGQNATNVPDLHVNFNLSKAGEFIGLYAPNGTNIDSVVFGAQTNDVSQGRWPDGNAAPFFAMTNPTPRAANILALSGNTPPSLASIGSRTLPELTTLSFTAVGSDPDVGQTLAYSLDPGAPPNASIADGSPGPRNDLSHRARHRQRIAPCQRLRDYSGHGPGGESPSCADRRGRSRRRRWRQPRLHRRRLGSRHSRQRPELLPRPGRACGREHRSSDRGVPMDSD